MPQFPGGDVALMKYIGENTRYPDFSRVNHIQGKVIVRFCISEKGEVNRVGVLQGVSADLDAEAIRVVKALPAFKPGRQGGKEVPVWFMVPISFTLR
jgi:protein TonB